jgi:hypothetical protein
MGSLRDAILAADDLPREQVSTPEWAPSGAPYVYVRGLTAAERDEYEQGLTERGPDGKVQARSSMKNLRAHFVVRVVVDENGERVFADGDVKALGEKSAAIVDRLWEKGRELSGMATVEEEENPSTGDQDEPSSSDSPSPSE